VTIRSDGTLFVGSELRHKLASFEFTPIAELADRAAHLRLDFHLPDPSLPPTLANACLGVRLAPAETLEVTRTDGTVITLIAPLSSQQICYLGDLSIASDLSARMLDIASREPDTRNEFPTEGAENGT
jgi:hypothetical protein